MAGNSTVLDIKDISVCFDGFYALTEVNAAVKRHSIHFFIGPNGAGKTTLLDIICGKTKPTAGSVIFHPESRADVRLTGMPEYKIVREGVGRKFQVPSVFGRPTADELAQIDRVLDKVGLLDKAQTRAGSLAHGQKQWLEIGMQLVQQPEIIMLDEPAAGMGKPETFKTGEILREIQKGCTIIVIEHDMDFVRQAADIVTVLHEGKVLTEGTVDEVLADATVQASIWDAARPQAERKDVKTMLKIRGLESCYGESCIVSGLTLDVPKGEIVGLIGRNGVGKSTTLKSIMGLVKTPHGAIELDGEDIIRRPTYERAAAGLGYVPQSRDIFPQMTVQENLELALYAQKKHGKVPDYIYDLFPILPKFAARRGGDLSGGQQQLAIARALVADPKVLILDAPTEGIQPSVSADIGTAIQRVNKELGLTVLLVEQYLDFVLENTTQLHVMEKGALIYSSTTAEADGAHVQRLMTA